jgi:hypothetical protein
MEIYDRKEVIEILDSIGMPESRVMNWTRDWEDERTLKIEGSIKTGSRTLYTESDIYKIGLAFELRRVGLAAKPIGNILKSITRDLKEITWLTISREKEGDPFDISEGNKERKETVWLTVNVGELVNRLQGKIAEATETRGKKAEEKKKRRETDENEG